MHDVSAELHEHNASFHAEKIDGNKSTTSGRSNPEIRPPGNLMESYLVYVGD